MRNVIFFIFSTIMSSGLGLGLEDTGLGLGLEHAVVEPIPGYSGKWPGRARARPSLPRCTKYNSPPTNGQCTNFILFDVAQ